MMRALWTSASGMVAQQFNIDVVSNNLANVNTASYKKQRAEFKDLLYETISRASVVEDGGKPVNLQVGHGVAVQATGTNFSMGNWENTGNSLDVAIDGEAFFAIERNGEVLYTRDGNFKISVGGTEDGSGARLVTSDGYSLLTDREGGTVDIDLTVVTASSITISPDGTVSYIDDDGVVQNIAQISIYKFPNRDGLEKVGSNFLKETPASGVAQLDERSNLVQGMIEMSNVQVVEEMVRLITAQRAYEINSKAIQTADEMLSTANSLKR